MEEFTFLQLKDVSNSANTLRILLSSESCSTSLSEKINKSSMKAKDAFYVKLERVMSNARSNVCGALVKPKGMRINSNILA